MGVKPLALWLTGTIELSSRVDPVTHSGKELSLPFSDGGQPLPSAISSAFKINRTKTHQNRLEKIGDDVFSIYLKVPKLWEMHDLKIFYFWGISCKIKKKLSWKNKVLWKNFRVLFKWKTWQGFFFFLNLIWSCFQKKYDTCHLKTSRWEKKLRVLSIKIGSFCLPGSMKVFHGNLRRSAGLYFFRRGRLQEPMNSCLWPWSWANFPICLEEEGYFLVEMNFSSPYFSRLDYSEEPSRLSGWNHSRLSLPLAAQLHTCHDHHGHSGAERQAGWKEDFGRSCLGNETLSSESASQDATPPQGSQEAQSSCVLDLLAEPYKHITPHITAQLHSLCGAWLPIIPPWHGGDHGF